MKLPGTVFPKLLRSGDPEIVETVLRLKQDHSWLEEDWLELSPLLDAVAAGQSWYDLDVLHNAAEVFAALLRDHVALEEALIYPEARARRAARRAPGDGPRDGSSTAQGEGGERLEPARQLIGRGDAGDLSTAMSGNAAL